ARSRGPRGLIALPRRPTPRRRGGTDAGAVSRGLCLHPRALRAGLARGGKGRRPQGRGRPRGTLGVATSGVGARHRAVRSRAEAALRRVPRRMDGARLRGGIVELVGPDAPESARFREDCAELAAALRTSGPFLEAYPGQAWPVDTVVAVSALALHDRILEPADRRVRERWVAEAEAAVDPRTGLLPHQVRPVWSGARGSSQSLVQRFLPEIDEAWAREQ